MQRAPPSDRKKVKQPTILRRVLINGLGASTFDTPRHERWYTMGSHQTQQVARMEPGGARIRGPAGAVDWGGGALTRHGEDQDVFAATSALLPGSSAVRVQA